MNWLKQNWFKVGLLVIVLLSVITYFYIRVKEHNLDVVNSMRLCANLSGDAVQNCADAVKRQIIKF